MMSNERVDKIVKLFGGSGMRSPNEFMDKWNSSDCQEMYADAIGVIIPMQIVLEAKQEIESFMTENSAPSQSETKITIEEVGDE